MNDIQTRADIEQLLHLFYARALEDDLIGHFFTQVVPLHLPSHIPLITDFWEAVVLGAHGYRKNVMEVHRHIHQLSPIGKEHLERWIDLFTQTLDQNFAGPRVELMKQRARSIATLMDMKLNHQGVQDIRRS